MGFFERRRPGAPHPRQEPVFSGALTEEELKNAFAGCADFTSRQVYMAGDSRRAVTLCALEGMVRTERVNDYLLRPLARDRRLGEWSLAEGYEVLAAGGLPTLGVERIATLDAAVFALMDGAVVMLFPALGKALKCMVPTEEKRAVTAPEDEPDPKGGRDSFVESLRTNTSLLRRRLRSPLLRVGEHTVGRQTRTPVDVVYLEGIADPAVAAEAARRLDGMDIDGALDVGHMEQYLCDTLDTPFPQMLTTQRPDRFCANLLAGRVGVLVDGIPLGFLLPGTVGLCMAAEQDRTANWMTAACLAALRYGALLVTLLLPAVYVAAVLFHPEMIPLPLARAIVAAKEDVPFGTLFETVTLLLAFEVIQEAGLRLPGNLGQTVSILGGLVVGSAAVEAKILSPAVLIVVAAAGIAGYTVPSQDFAAGIRLWRLALTLAAGAAGLLGVALGSAALVGHLAGLTSFGTPYLTLPALRVPFPRVKLRPKRLSGWNRRNQR